MSCGVQYASRSHEEQALVEYVGKSMSGGCVDGDLRPYSYRRHHITYLANYAVGEDAPNVVLQHLSLIHISEPTRLRRISYAVFCLKKKKNTNNNNKTIDCVEVHNNIKRSKNKNS